MTRRKLRIAIATNGRFHVLDLARELAALKHEVCFYSALPDWRAEQFGLDARYCRSILSRLLPFVVWERALPGSAPAARERLFDAALNRAIAARLEPCDVFIGMSGLILEAAHLARRKFGATIILERGSQHMLAQKRILEQAGQRPPTDRAVERELAGYKLADHIMVPSEQAADSFRPYGEAHAKVRVNPYGVDLSMFPLRTETPGTPFNLIFVGRWERQKGVDLLVRALESLPEIYLVHVGPLAGEPFPENPRFRHHDPVDQRKLAAFYHGAHALVLASRQEGLAMVQAQALASGLPIVCSDRTGGRDLAFSPGLTARIREFPADSHGALRAAIRATLDGLGALPPLAEKDRALLSWNRYGARYSDFLESVVPNGASR